MIHKIGSKSTILEKVIIEYIYTKINNIKCLKVLFPEKYWLRTNPIVLYVK